MSACAIFAESMHVFRQVLWATCMCRCVCQTGVVNISVYICVHARYRMCICAHVCVLVCSLALGNEDGGVQLVYESTCCLAWRLIFDWRKDRGVVCVFCIFGPGGSVCGCMSVYRAHTHAAQMGYSVVSPDSEVGIRHLEGPKKPDGLNLGIHVFVYAYNVHMCMYMLWGLGLTAFFLNIFFQVSFEKEKQKMWTQTTDNLVSQIRSERIDPESNVLNHYS